MKSSINRTLAISFLCFFFTNTSFANDCKELEVPEKRAVQMLKERTILCNNYKTGTIESEKCIEKQNIISEVLQNIKNAKLEHCNSFSYVKDCFTLKEIETSYHERLVQDLMTCKDYSEGTIQYNYCKTGEHPAKPLYEEVKYLVDNKCR